MQPKVKGILWAVLSMLLWSAGFPAARMLISRGLLDPTTLGMLRFFFGGVLMLSVGHALKMKGLFTLSLKNIIALAVLGLIGTAMMGFLLLYAQKTVSAVNSAMIEAESPLIICILSIFILRKISVMQIVGLLFGFFGCLMVTRVITAEGLRLQSFQFGDMLIVLSALCWSLYTVLGSKVIAKTGAYAFTAWTMLFGSLWLAAMAIISPAPLLLPAATDFFAWTVVVFYVIFPTVVAFYAWNQAQIYISLALLSLSEYFTPFCTSVIAYFWLGEELSTLQITGALIICGSVLIEPEITELFKKKKEKLFKPSLSFKETAQKNDCRAAFFAAQTGVCDNYFEESCLKSAAFYDIFLKDERIGFFALQPQKSGETVLTAFDIRPEFRAFSKEAFRNILKTFAVKTAFVLTGDEFFLSACFDEKAAVTERACLFKLGIKQDAEAPVYPREALVLVNNATDYDVMTRETDGFFEASADEVLSGKIQIWHLTDKGRSLGYGCIADNPFNKQAASCGMFTLPVHRGRGVGRSLIYYLTQICVERGLTPVAGCAVFNTASRKTIESAGGIAQTRWLSAAFKHI